MFFTTTWPDCPIRICAVLVFCVLSLVSASAQQPPPTSPEKEQKIFGRSVIRGRVIYADTGRPLRRAEVSLVAQDSEIQSDYSLTDRNGEFLFNNISAGKYFVLVRAPDIVSPWLQTGRGDSLKLKIALGQIEDGFSEVTVDGRGSVKTEIRASRGGVITGRVMSEVDEPIAKAQIKLFQIKSGKLRPEGATANPLERDKWMFETDSRGIYRIAGLATGEYLVRASESDEGGNPDDAAEGSYTDGSMMVAFHPKALRSQDASRVKVQQGSETKDVDIRFTERIGHRVSGIVTVGGKAARGAEISLIRDEPEWKSFRFGSAQAQTDSNGHWEIRNVPDDNYTLLISGQVIGLVHLGERRYATVAPLRRELIVAGTDVTDLKFDLVAGGTLNGVVAVEGGTQLPERLMIELVSPDLSSRDPALKPVTNEETKSSETDDPDSAVGRAFVKEKGVFSISELPSGLFQFRLSGLGTGHYVKSITLNEKDLLRNPVKIEAGKTLNGVRIVLSSEIVLLSGRAIEKADRAKPLTNAAVLLFPVEVERRRMSEIPITARTDKEGRFVVKAAPGDYFVFVFDRRRKDLRAVMPTETSLIKNASTLQKISLQRGDEKRIVEVVGP